MLTPPPDDRLYHATCRCGLTAWWVLAREPVHLAPTLEGTCPACGPVTITTREKPNGR